MCIEVRDVHWKNLKKDTVRYAKATESGSKAAKKDAKTEKRKATRKRITRENYRRNPLNHKLMHIFHNIIHPDRPEKGKLSKLVKQTSFHNGAHVIAHFEKHRLPGKSSIDHIIPRCRYDHSDPEDVKKCWSPENTRSLPHAENDTKGKKIVPSLVAKVTVHVWPRAWGGVMPEV